MPFFEGEAGSPSNTKLHGPRPTSIPSGIFVHPAVWPQWTWAKNWGLCPLGEGTWVPINTRSPRMRPSSVPSGILMHPAVWPQQTWGRKMGGCAPFLRGELGPHLAQCGRAEAYLHTKWHLDASSRLATIEMG